MNANVLQLAVCYGIWKTNVQKLNTVDMCEKCWEPMHFSRNSGKLDVTRRYYGMVILLKNHNVVHDEIITYSRLKATLIGLIWRYIPDLTFKHRRYMIVDVQ